MTKFLFAANSVGQFPGSFARFSGYDATRVPYALALSQGTISEANPFVNDPTATEVWLKAYISNGDRTSPGNGGSVTDTFLGLRNPEGIDVFQFSSVGSSTSGRLILQNGVSTVNVDIATAYPEFGTAIFTFQLIMGDPFITVNAYKNHAFFGTAQIATVVGITIPDRVILGPGSRRDDRVGNFYSGVSEIMVSDGDPGTARLNVLTPNNQAFYDDWDGTIATLLDYDLATGLKTILPNQQQSMLISSYTGANSIASVFTCSTASSGPNAPTQLQHLFRQSNVDYLSSMYPVNESINSQLTGWDLNPATNLAWDIADLVNIEAGFKSIA